MSSQFSQGGRASRSFHSSRYQSRNRRPARRNSGYQVSKSLPHSRYISAPLAPQEEIPVYQPVHSFESFAFQAEILQNVLRRGYSVPTAIQDQAIPYLLEGKDVVGLAHTGTGKTAAFLLPFIQKIVLHPQQGLLVLAPTRELAVQIFEELKVFTTGMQLGISLCVGGMNMNQQILRLRENPHFVIATPGRLKDLIQRKIFKTDLFRNIVLDEVDRMLDIGFRQDILFLISQLPENRQSAFFSATMDQATEEIMQRFLIDPVRISVKEQERVSAVDQDIVSVKPGESKAEVLYKLLLQQEFEKVIVFGRTKHGINKLARQLSEWGIAVSAIHGNKSQSVRQRALRDFKQGRVKALLATDIAARGIDVADVTHVINFDEPQTYEDYIHRIGRTGRAGKTGKALTFVC